MNCQDFQNKLHAYLDRELSETETERLDRHVVSCSHCRDEFQQMIALKKAASSLPKHAQPARDLWPEIHENILQKNPVEKHPALNVYSRNDEENQQAQILQMAHRVSSPSFISKSWWKWAIAAVLLLAVGNFWRVQNSEKYIWKIDLVDSTQLSLSKNELSGQLAVGGVLATNESTRAQLSIGNIGRVELEPKTRIRLLKARAKEHRIALDIGKMHAMVWAPPKLFFVETPSALAIDLGCAYTLEVTDSGNSILRVTIGYVAFVNNGRQSVVPSGAICETRPGIGPGTPFYEDVSQKFRDALVQYDFYNGDENALKTLLAEARSDDNLTLWHLLLKENPENRAMLYDRLASFRKPPKGVTREGIINLDRNMLNLWRDALNLPDIDLPRSGLKGLWDRILYWLL